MSFNRVPCLLVLSLILSPSQFATSSSDNCCPELQSQIDSLKKALACPVGFVYVKELETCYKLNTQPLTWDHAMTSCASYGANLAIITSARQTHYINEYIKSLGVTLSTVCSSGPWIGSQRRDQHSCSTPFVWKTSDGSQTLLTYTNWQHGQPNCYRNNENCVHIRGLKENLMWNDAPCSAILCSLCQK